MTQESFGQAGAHTGPEALSGPGLPDAIPPAPPGPLPITPQDPAAAQQFRTRRNYALFAGAGLLVGLGMGLLLAQLDFSSPSNALANAVAECQVEDDPYIQLGDEGQSLAMDSEGQESGGADFADIACVLGAVNLPDSVSSQMDSTRALDGRQTAEWDGFSASWSYHPDSGMNVVVNVEDER